MKKFIEEFKSFALRGNVMDMAIGVIIGGAFTSIVTSLTDNLINPLLGLAGNTDLSAFTLQIAGIELKYGAFLTSVINFLIMAFVLFCMLKAPSAPARRIHRSFRPRRGTGGRTAVPCGWRWPSRSLPCRCRRR